MDNPDIRAVFIGPENVGKTCLIRHLGTDDFLGEGMTLPSVGAAFTCMEILATNGHRVTIGLWDTPGQTTYRDLMLPPLRSADFVVLVFDLTDKRSLTNLRPYFEKAKSVAPGWAKFFVLGNKCDLEKGRSVSADEIEDYAVKIHADGFFEVSAKTGDGISAFRSIIGDASFRGREPTKTISLAPRRRKKEGCPC
jgi:small GTP-binding protein